MCFISHRCRETCGDVARAKNVTSPPNCNSSTPLSTNIHARISARLEAHFSKNSRSSRAAPSASQSRTCRLPSVKGEVEGREGLPVRSLPPFLAKLGKQIYGTARTPKASLNFISSCFLFSHHKFGNGRRKCIQAKRLIFFALRASDLQKAAAILHPSSSVARGPLSKKGEKNTCLLLFAQSDEEKVRTNCLPNAVVTANGALWSVRAGRKQITSRS